jgi:hypothetical protein
MQIFGLPALTYLLIGTRESYAWTTSSDLRRSRRRNIHLRCESLDKKLRLRRSFLNQVGLAGFNLIVGTQPAIAAGTSMVETGVPSSKNKKLGGLAFKIQSIGHVMVSYELLVPVVEYPC